MSEHGWRPSGKGKDRRWQLQCVVCATTARCPSCLGSLRWTEDQWWCPGCGDEWPADAFGECQGVRA